MSKFESDDMKKIAAYTLIPAGLTCGTWYLLKQDKKKMDFFEKLKRPSWAISSTCAMEAIDVLTVAPVGYAVYLITKNVILLLVARVSFLFLIYISRDDAFSIPKRYLSATLIKSFENFLTDLLSDNILAIGTQSSDVQTALAAVGATAGFGLLTTLATFQNNDLKCWAGAMAATAAAAGVATGLCYKLDQRAGWLIAPFAVWCGYNTAALIGIYMNEKDSKKI